MLTQAHIDALTLLVGRELTPGEVDALGPLVAIRNDVAIASLLSIGRTKHGPTQIGTGTIMVVFADHGGAFLDAVEALGKTNSNVRWGFDPVLRGVLDLSIAAGRTQLELLKEELPVYATDLDRLLQVGVVVDPIFFDAVSRKLNIVEGRAQL